jgi:hypothetical protein
LWFGGLGAILFGSGFSLATEASHWKHSGESLLFWASGGTLGIALMIFGIILLIKSESVKRR